MPRTGGGIGGTVRQEVLGVIVLVTFLGFEPPIEGPLAPTPIVKVWKADGILMQGGPISTRKDSPEVRI
jgi:hypothetical protein